MSNFLNDLIAKGYTYFTYAQVREALKVSDIAIRAALRRLKQKGILAQPLQGFYVIVPPEYQILGCRPAEQFIHELMQHLKAPYYVGLLSAAQIHGAAHHRPQQLQVVINQKRKPIICGKVKIVFITHKDCSKVPTVKVNNPYGIFLVSTPEATAIDIVTFPNKCGGMDNVLTVLNGLVKKLNPKKIYDLAHEAKEITWVQRLGYLLDLLEADKLSAKMQKAIKNRRLHERPLVVNLNNLSYKNKKPSRSPNTVSERFELQNTSNYRFQYTKNRLHLKKETDLNSKGKKIRKTDYPKSTKWKIIINKKLKGDI